MPPSSSSGICSVSRSCVSGSYSTTSGLWPAPTANLPRIGSIAALKCTFFTTGSAFSIRSAHPSCSNRRTEVKVRLRARLLRHGANRIIECGVAALPPAQIGEPCQPLLNQIDAEAQWPLDRHLPAHERLVAIILLCSALSGLKVALISCTLPRRCWDLRFVRIQT